MVSGNTEFNQEENKDKMYSPGARYLMHKCRVVKLWNGLKPWLIWIFIQVIDIHVPGQLP